MRRFTFIIACFVLTFFNVNAQEDTKVVLISLDGLRWQELFTGADSKLVAHKDFVHDTTGLKSDFWRETPEERRKVLMPFFWSELVQIGQLHGNRNKGSKVNLTNSMWFSYPGYNEILTGKADDKRITSNDKMNNPNKTVLEIANNTDNYKGKVAAFGSWDVFPFIINEDRSGVPVNAGFELAKGEDLSEKEVLLNDMQPKTPSPWGSVRLDAFTHYYALEHMKKEHPNLVYVAYGETDDFAHDGEYDAYLKSANATDAMIQELWHYTQSDSFYKDKTLFIITTDHGRGTDPITSWKDHGNKVKNAGDVWMVCFGKGVKPLGEITTSEQVYTNQIAPTVLKALSLPVDKQMMPAEALPLSK
ncbi:MAG: phosphoglyceromutase [Pseudozobellia sp.]|nr:phosphoglyceromutase [Pseudozobellia sp.]MBG46653.1 phosphoglyceromutase [Pseudozobellia sp.]MBG49324.1 phosphoglyceromutase [Pseudozobellia sp.]|tara:strand:- start:905 stop:1987 length:1083 start_codon:yes stop_codon:yes gene_type:complete